MTIPRFKELLDLSGKVALVTGASRNIGAGIARRLAQAGAAVIVHYRSAADGAAEVVEAIAGEGGRAHALQAELSDAKRVAALVADASAIWG